MERTDQLLADLKECEAASLVGAHDAGVEMAARALQTARECGLRPEAALAAAWLAEHQLRRGESEKAAESARAALAEADALDLHGVGVKLRNTLTRAWCQLGRADEALPEAIPAWRAWWSCWATIRMRSPCCTRQMKRPSATVTRWRSSLRSSILLAHCAGPGAGLPICRARWHLPKRRLQICARPWPWCSGRRCSRRAMCVGKWSAPKSNALPWRPWGGLRRCAPRLIATGPSP